MHVSLWATSMRARGVTARVEMSQTTMRIASALSRAVWTFKHSIIITTALLARMRANSLTTDSGP